MWILTISSQKISAKCNKYKHNYAYKVSNLNLYYNDGIFGSEILNIKKKAMKVFQSLLRNIFRGTMKTCTCACVYVYLCVCTPVCTRTYVCIHLCALVCICTCVHTCTCGHLCVRAPAGTCVHAAVCTLYNYFNHYITFIEYLVTKNT